MVGGTKGRVVSCVTGFWIVVAPRGMGALAIKRGGVPDRVVAAVGGGDAFVAAPGERGACANRGGGRFPW